jgi:hypothetical protein
MSQLAHAECVSEATRTSGSARTYPPSEFARTYHAKRDDQGALEALEQSERITMADGTVLDMLDPVSIRRYVRKQLALNVEPSAAQLSRLEMMGELADDLEAKTPAAASPSSIDDLAAARERLRQARPAERQGK